MIINDKDIELFYAMFGSREIDGKKKWGTFDSRKIIRKWKIKKN